MRRSNARGYIMKMYIFVGLQCDGTDCDVMVLEGMDYSSLQSAIGPLERTSLNQPWTKYKGEALVFRRVEACAAPAAKSRTQKSPPNVENGTLCNQCLKTK